MEASRRQHYLSAMGIDCWVPKQQLPGAAPGRVLVRKAIEQTAALQDMPGSPPGHGSNTSDSGAEQSPATRLQRELTGTAPAQNTIAQTSPRQPQVAGQAGASFQLAFYAWAPELLVVDQIEDARMQQQLIGNLLFALGHTSLQRKQPDYFEWPMPGGRRALTLSPHEMIFGVLQRMTEQHKPKHILIMGKLGAQHVLGADGSEFTPGAPLASSPLYPGVSIITTHSSAELLQNPQLKAETWQHLQSLRV
ncbi:MAG: hypothetical protein ACR2PS_18565 [Pseudomonadales bacterium]